MKPFTALVVILMVGISFSPQCACGREGGGAGACPGPALSRAGQRAEPDFTGSGAHSRAAVYDFSNTFMYNRWSIVMETGKATLMKNIQFTNDSWSAQAPLPAGQERAWPVAVYDDADKLVIVQGGYFWKSGMQDPVYAQPLCTYDPAADTWTDRGPSKLPQLATGVWDSHDGCLMVCGGTENVSGSPVIHNETWAWFPSNGSWVRLADMPAARYGQCSVWDPDDRLMLVFGGRNDTHYFNDLWSFDPDSNTWTKLSLVTDEEPLVRAYSTAVWNPNKKEMVVFGGDNPNVTFLSTWAFSYANNTWIHRTSAPYALSMHGACWDSNRSALIVFGGRYHPGNGQYSSYNLTWMYDADSDSWNLNPNAPLPGFYRVGSAAVFDPVKKRALVIGGCDPAGDELDGNWAFTLGQMSWTYFSPGFMQPPVLDLGDNFQSLDKIVWTENLPPGTSATLRLRTSDDNTSWHSFVSVANGAKPVQKGRYVIWNMSFAASPDLLSAPVISGVRFEYNMDLRPNCSAGEDQTGFKREAVRLVGNGSDPDGDSLTYKWSKLSSLAGIFDDPNLKEPTYTPLASGVHNLQLIVNDSFVEVASYVKVTVVNRPPVASAGPDGTGYKYQNMTLEGNGTDPDGDPLFYNWSQLSGEKVTIRNATSLRPTFAPGKVGNYTFQLKADDGENASYGIVNITVLNRAPVARLEASPVQVNVNGRVNFTAAASADPDGNVTKYLIDFGDGNNTGWTSKASMSYVYAQPGVYNATVKVMDDDGDQSLPSDAVRITVENARPVINASVAPEKGNTSTSFRFTVSPSSYDPDGRIVSYDWSFGDGATGSGSLATHVYSKRGNYTVILKATDDFGAVSELRLPVEVAGRSPVILSVVPLGAKSMHVDESLRLSVNAQDPDGGVLSYVWKVDGEVKGGNTSDYTYRPSKTGAHTVSVTVSNAVDSASNNWSVTVKDVEPSGSEGWMLWAGILVIIVVVALIAAMAMRRKKAA